jgi:hypothetical protein
MAIESRNSVNRYPEQDDHTSSSSDEYSDDAMEHDGAETEEHQLVENDCAGRDPESAEAVREGKNDSDQRIPEGKAETIKIVRDSTRDGVEEDGSEEDEGEEDEAEESESSSNQNEYEDETFDVEEYEGDWATLEGEYVPDSALDEEGPAQYSREELQGEDGAGLGPGTSRRPKGDESNPGYSSSFSSESFYQYEDDGLFRDAAIVLQRWYRRYSQARREACAFDKARHRLVIDIVARSVADALLDDCL